MSNPADPNPNTTPPRILILGAGLSGLALAQALKSHSPPIPFTIFERSTRASLRSQGYRIRIGPDGASALKRLLPAPLWQAFEATCATVQPGMAKLDALTGEKGAPLFGGRRGPPVKPMVADEGGFEDLVGGRSFNVDRSVVRNLFLCGLEEGRDVVFGKKAEGYAVLAAGEGVEVRFADGSVERGSFLVGADGVRSVVRRQMLPDFRLLDTEGRAVFGKTPISEDLLAEIPAQMGQGISISKDDKEARMMLFCDVIRFDRDAAAKLEDTVSAKLPQDYIYWVLGFRGDILDDRERERSLLRLSNEDSADLSFEMTETWHENIRTLLRKQEREDSSTLAILTAAPGFEQAWNTRSRDTTGLVTVMGDSAHPMPPVGGVGANTAWQDAYDLFSVLVSIYQEPDAFERIAAVQAYETKMLARAVPTVARSSGGAGHLIGMRPVGELNEAEWSH